MRVPFDVPSSPLKIGTIGILDDVTVPEGTCNLIFEALYPQQEEEKQYAFILRLIFCPSQNPDFSILKKGDELTTDVVLSKDAQHG